MTVTLCTSQPSRSIITLTMQLIGLFSSSTSRETFRALSRSFFDTSPDLSVWMIRSVSSPPNSDGYFFRSQSPTSSASAVSFIITNSTGFLPSGAKLLAVFLPALDSGREVSLIACAGDVRPLLGDALGDALQRALDDVVDDRLLERVVEHRPGKQLPFAVARRGGEVELRGQPVGDVRVQAGG